MGASHRAIYSREGNRKWALDHIVMCGGSGMGASRRRRPPRTPRLSRL